jgi:hypothetical protein
MKRKQTNPTFVDDLGYEWPGVWRAFFRPHRPGPLERKFLKVLDEASGEKDAHAFLKKHDHLVGMAFHSNTHPRGVISEFKLGAELRCDFIVLSCCSAWWTVDFVELKSPNARLYLKDGTQAQALRTANRQIRERKLWIQENESYLRNRLSDLFQRVGLFASGAMSVPDAATEIRDPRCTLNCDFHIVIGRRARLTLTDQQARVQDSKDTHVNIATYDRLVEVARRYDKASRFDKEGFRYRKG